MKFYHKLLWIYDLITESRIKRWRAFYNDKTYSYLLPAYEVKPLIEVFGGTALHYTDNKYINNLN